MATNPARPPTIWEVADRFRAELEARERAAAGEMIRAWQPVRRSLLRETGRLAQAIAERQAQGRRVPVSWLFGQARLGEWESRVKRELAAWRKDAEPAAAKAAREAATLGPEAAMEMVAVRAIPFPELAARRLVRFPRDEVAQMVATVQEGSPLHELLARLGPETAAIMRETLVRGIALGSGPVVMGRELATALDGNLRRGLLIARTETMRTFRETTRLSYAARPDVVGGWRWWSSRDRRTCAACYAMHGTLHPVEERLDGHPACRCTMIPELAADTGIAGPTIPTGERLFEELDAATQRSILGPGRFRLYENGEARLSDMVARPVHPRWGSMRREANLRDVRANAEARRAGRPTPATTGATPPRLEALPAPPPPRPEWRASMPREEAERWAAGSAIDHDVFHMTRRENVESLREQGFDLGRRLFGRTWGDGVYAALSDTDGTLAIYAHASDEFAMQRLRVRVERPFRYEVGEGVSTNAYALADAAGVQDELAVLEAARDRLRAEAFRRFPLPPEPPRSPYGAPRTPAELEWSAQAGGVASRRRAWLAAQGYDADFTVQGFVVRRLAEQGFDALVVTEPTGVTISVGGNQVVVFDPRNVVIVEE